MTYKLDNRDYFYSISTAGCTLVENYVRLKIKIERRIDTVTEVKNYFPFTWRRNFSDNYCKTYAFNLEYLSFTHMFIARVHKATTTLCRWFVKSQRSESIGSPLNRHTCIHARSPNKHDQIYVLIARCCRVPQYGVKKKLPPPNYIFR